jgi:hypothetical protein
MTDRPIALVTLADALDAQGETAEAFATYTAGKADFARLHDLRRPGGERAVDVCRRVAEAFKAAPEAAWSGGAVESMAGETGHVFLIGFPRSGTTLLEQTLANHPDVVVSDERPLLLDAELEFIFPKDGIERLAEATEDALEAHRARYWRRALAYGADPTGKLFVNKQPLNTMRLPLIAKLFPDASILFARRDPRDVVFSCFRRSFALNASTYEFTSPERAAAYYDAVMAADELYRVRLTLPRHEVRHEDLVEDFEAHARAVCDFLGLQWTDAMADIAQGAKDRAIRTPSAAQLARGLSTARSGLWRPYAKELAPVLPVLKPWVKRFGYPTD